MAAQKKLKVEDIVGKLDNLHSDIIAHRLDHLDAQDVSQSLDLHQSCGFEQPINGSENKLVMSQERDVCLVKLSITSILFDKVCNVSKDGNHDDKKLQEICRRLLLQDYKLLEYLDLLFGSGDQLVAYTACKTAASVLVHFPTEMQPFPKTWLSGLLQQVTESPHSSRALCSFDLFKLVIRAHGNSVPSMPVESDSAAVPKERVPWKDQHVGFGGIGYVEGQLVEGQMPGDWVLVRTLVLVLLKACSVVSKLSEPEEALDIVPSLRRLSSFVCKKLAVTAEGRAAKAGQYAGSESWLFELFSDQDDSMIEAMLCLLDINTAVSRYTTDCSHADVIRSLNPHRIFLQFLETTTWDHSILLDLLISMETSFLAYITRYLHLVITEWQVSSLAVRGYPFHVLSAKKLPLLGHFTVLTLALIDAKITDVENNTFAAFSNLNKLSLESNRLTNVKQTWFTGLEKLLVLNLFNNSIKEIEPLAFLHLTSLNVLDLENNLLQVVNPSWLFGLKGSLRLNLRSNAIDSISPGSFQHLQLTLLDLRGNDLSCLDGEVLSGQSSLSMLHVSSGMLSSVHDAKPIGMMWSLDRLAHVFRWQSVTMVVEVPHFLFCARHNGHELSFGWMFDSSNNVPGNREFGAVNPGRSCGDLDTLLSTMSIHAPVVVLATNGSLKDKLVPNTLELCRKVWEYDVGITVGLVENSIFRLVSMAKENTTSEGVAMSFVQTQDTSTLTTTDLESSSSQKHTHTTHSNAKNITCIILNRSEHTKLFFTIAPVQRQTNTTSTSYWTDIDPSSSLAPYSETTQKVLTFSTPWGHSTLQMDSTPGQDLEVPPAADHVLISVIVSVVVGLVVSSLVVLIGKVCAARLNSKDKRAGDDAHIWTIPPGVAFPGLLRSASLPACSGKVASDDAASCRSLPAVLTSIDLTYSEIPDDVAAAQRPLPSLPHVYSEIPDNVASAQRPLPSIPHVYCQIPDNVISDVVRSASLPACTRGDAPDDTASCRSLPAVLKSMEPSYSQIPDHLAVAQRPLPALPRACWEFPDHETTVQRPRPAPPHTYSEIPDDEDSGPIPFYADAAEFSLHVVKTRMKHQRAFRDNTATSSRHRSGRPFATYGLDGQTKAQSNIFYRNANVVEGIRARRQLRTALVSQPANQGVTTYVNVTDAILSRGEDVTGAHIASLTLPNTYWPWEIPGEGTRNTPRRGSLPLLTLPNTYWPWEIPGDRTRNTPQQASLSTLPNTYWPWEVPGEGTRNSNTPGRGSLPLLTLPNTYWPWEIPGNGTRNTPQRASLPYVTLPNTYWLWKISGDRTRNTPLRSSLSTLPNTYWPWEIPGEGTRNTPRRASLPLVTIPNTYWPWEIPGEETRNTPRRGSLPLVTIPNTYWPWEIPGREPVTHHGVGPSSHCLTPTGLGRYQGMDPITRCGVGPSPSSHLTNTYWP
ncbi:LRIG2 [Branchiostoma lanceolatum]|uniref:LRIG2 protein n=1 Tax=Branchiostoma lanceolatum TaxID=7740 RepID=A0A8J9ZG78_BRALA|nr:LRIG2 [Branchiostoma lanceolatum]